MMIRITSSATLLVATISIFQAQTRTSADPNALVTKIQNELSGPLTDDGRPDGKVPHGTFLHGVITNSKIYPGTENDFQVYVPAQYDPARPACLLLKLDGMGDYEATVLDNLIAKKDVPVIIGIGIASGTVWKDPRGAPNRRPARFNRSYEFDSLNNRFPEFVLNELLPAVRALKTRDGRTINLSLVGNDHAVMGASTGGIGSFTLAWRRPDQFTRVYSEIGTFVSMRGGHEYPALIRKTDPKPLRIFLEDGSADAWNPLFGSWYEANLTMESALAFAGYDVAHAWGAHDHDSHPGQVILPDVLRWLWRDYPTPVKAGISTNSTLQELTLPTEGWTTIAQTFQSASALSSNPNGEVYLSDASAETIYRLGLDNKPAPFATGIRVSGQAFGPHGTLYAVVPGEKEIIALEGRGTRRTITRGIVGQSILATHDNTLYVTEPGAQTTPSRIWRIEPHAERKLIDAQLLSASGLAFSPDGALFYAADQNTRAIYSYVVQPDGSLADKEPFYWLHVPDDSEGSRAQDLAVDTHGNLYAATPMGIQICDQNGRVRAILSLPAPSGPVRSLCFAGEHFEFLYATDGTHVFKRRLKIPGSAPWATPVAVPSQGPG